MTCPSCQEDNRSEARFCRNCGKALSTPATVAPSLDRFVGLRQVRQDLSALLAVAKLNQDRKKASLVTQPLRLSFAFLGNTGTGKTQMAQYLGESLRDLGVLTTGVISPLAITTLRDSSTPEAEFRSRASRAKGGVLVIEETHKALPLLSLLVKHLDQLDPDLAVVFCGLNEPMQEHFNNHQDDAQRFGHLWVFPDPTLEDLKAMTLAQVTARGYTVTPEFEAELGAFIAQEASQRDVQHKHGWLIERHIVKRLVETQAQRLSMLSTRTTEDLQSLTRDDLPLVAAKTFDEVMADLDQLVGFSEVRRAIQRLKASLDADQARNSTGPAPRTRAHIVLTGNPGTGKTTLARKLGEVFRAVGVLPVGHVVEVDRSKLVASYTGQTGPLVNSACDQAMGGVLFIDEAYDLQKDDGTVDSFGQEAINALLKRMEDDQGRFVVVAAGYKDKMDHFLNANDGFRSRFAFTFDLPDYRPTELLEIWKGLVRTGNLSMTPELQDRVLRHLEFLYASRTRTFANGRTVLQLFQDTKGRQGQRVMGLPEDQRSPDVMSELRLEDFPIPEPKVRTPDEILATLDQLVGLESVKQEMKTLLDLVRVQKRREPEAGVSASIGLHFVFTGNPGTGKTTVARMLGELFQAMGLLPDGRVVEKGGPDLKGGYVGTTAKKVNDLVDQAMGGVFFLDEAYALTPEGGMDSYGREAIDTLLKRLEDDRGRFICVAAGYQHDMDRFLAANAGLRSRFTRTLHFEDYKPEELQAILERLARSQKYTLTPEASQRLPALFQDMYETRSGQFGNAREVRTLWERTVTNASTRVASQERQGLSPDPSTIEAEDLPLGPPVVVGPSPLEQLAGLIGMERVKDEVRNLIDYLKVEGLRAGPGTGPFLPNLHLVLTGNPGTGKTTVARILGGVFKELGLLKRGHVVETDKDGLVAEFVGQTGPKTQRKVDEALGGLLFIDEAYGLAPTQANNFGKEAIDTLLKRMEDDRGKFVVLAAGYKGDMERFLNSNDGLRSRFTRYIDFPDYSPEEMTQIYLKLVTDKRLIVAPGVEDKLKRLFQSVYDHRDRSFANGRTVRNLFEAHLQSQARRVAPLDHPTPEQLNTLTPEDVR